MLGLKWRYDISINSKALSDQNLVDNIRSAEPISQEMVDEYYRRCISIYLNFIGIHWHTGFYLDDNKNISPVDQNRMTRCIAESIDLSQQDRVLDVGCGIGGTACYLAKEYGCMVNGLTPVETQRETAFELISKFGVEDRVTIDLGHASLLPYPDNSFDVVLFFESPCHFPDRQTFFNEVFRVLKPNGRMAGEDWLATDLISKDMLKKWIQPICKTWAIPMLGTGSCYLTQFENAGFVNNLYVDMQSEILLSKGFSVTETQQSQLREEIQSCQSPLLELTLEGLLSLGQAVAAGAFTIGRFIAHKPA